MRVVRLFIIFFVLVQTINTFAQDFVLPLYTGEIPNAKNNGTQEVVERKDITVITKVQNPDISVFSPTNRMATGQAVIICPGGGYWILAYDLEGTDFAKYFNSIGVAAVVLKYRLPTTGNSFVPHNTPIMDAQQAMRLVRFNAKKWNIKPDKIGIMGFSAGGHLASTLGTHFDYGDKTAKDSVAQQSCRPDFMILAYPVISFVDSAAHKGSAEALCGKIPCEDLLINYSSELQVKEDTPPAFFVHADNDSGVPVENTLLMYKALRAKKISAELHILSEGEHGFGLAIGNDHINSWTNSLKLWLKWLNTKK
jgi:acetyl esterase/lipase